MLKTPDVVQADLFTTAERGQYNRNVAALESRLNQIPAEIKQETTSIKARYPDPEARLFPVAETCLVPAGLAS